METSHRSTEDVRVMRCKGGGGLNTFVDILSRCCTDTDLIPMQVLMVGPM